MLFSRKNQTPRQLKIIDFGMSALINQNQQVMGVYGTPKFVAPEILKGTYNEKCDVWSIGVIGFYLLTGLFPFNGPDRDIIFEKIKSGKMDLNKRWYNVSEEARNFLIQCLTF